MNTNVSSNWQIGYVAVSVVIAVVGAALAMNAAGPIRHSGSRSGNTIAAGVALGGIGIWSMHFVGMLALRLDMATSYSMPEAIASLLAAIVASFLAFAFAAKAPRSVGRVAVAGSLLGAGIVVMHYVGMYSMKFGGHIEWRYGLVAVSAVIAVVAAAAALWIALNTESFVIRGLAGLLMGAAVSATHYTGMGAADFICTTTDRTIPLVGFGYVSSRSLPDAAIFLAMVTAVLVAAYQLYQASRADYDGFAVSAGASRY